VGAVNRQLGPHARTHTGQRRDARQPSNAARWRRTIQTAPPRPRGTRVAPPGRLTEPSTFTATGVTPLRSALYTCGGRRRVLGCLNGAWQGRGAAACAASAYALWLAQAHMAASSACSTPGGSTPCQTRHTPAASPCRRRASGSQSHRAVSPSRTAAVQTPQRPAAQEPNRRLQMRAPRSVLRCCCCRLWRDAGVGGPRQG
jgi:hypothetical protein